MARQEVPENVQQELKRLADTHGVSDVLEDGDIFMPDDGEVVDAEQHRLLVEDRISNVLYELWVLYMELYTHGFSVADISRLRLPVIDKNGNIRRNQLNSVVASWMVLLNRPWHAADPDAVNVELLKYKSMIRK
jgi:hypothetical protein